VRPVEPPGDKDDRPIASFRGTWFFLSNFFPAPVALDGVVYPTVEHAYQAARCADADDRESIRAARSAGEAKRLGRVAEQVATWPDLRDGVMLDLIRQKFASPRLRELLLATGSRSIIEENTWGDTYWGTSDGVGENRLGQLLELVRFELRCQSEDARQWPRPSP
jgi:ribA/ribD-fused uncharacterized protein